MYVVHLVMRDCEKNYWTITLSEVVLMLFMKSLVFVFPLMLIEETRLFFPLINAPLLRDCNDFACLHLSYQIHFPQSLFLNSSFTPRIYSKAGFPEIVQFI